MFCIRTIPVTLLAFIRPCASVAGIEEDVFVKVLKRIPLGVIIHMGSKFCLCQDVQFSIASITCIKLQIQWCLRTILLSGDIEKNPGPETLDFRCWNLNSIAAHGFLRVFSMEAYNSVYNYDLIGLVETHLDSTVDEERLSLDGYSLHRNDHPQNIKRCGVGLYVKDSPL